MTKDASKGKEGKKYFGKMLKPQEQPPSSTVGDGISAAMGKSDSSNGKSSPIAKVGQPKNKKDCY